LTGTHQFFGERSDHFRPGRGEKIQFLITGYDRAKREITGLGELMQFLITGYERLIWTSSCSLVIFCMNEYQENQIKRIKATFRAIRDYQVTIMILLIVISTLYGIHMFRYEYVKNQPHATNLEVYRIDRITNEVCLYIFRSVSGGNTNNAYSDDLMKMVEPCD